MLCVLPPIFKQLSTLITGFKMHNGRKKWWSLTHQVTITGRWLRLDYLQVKPPLSLLTWGLSTVWILIKPLFTPAGCVYVGLYLQTANWAVKFTVMLTPFDYSAFWCKTSSAECVTLPSHLQHSTSPVSVVFFSSALTAWGEQTANSSQWTRCFCFVDLLGAAVQWSDLTDSVSAVL